MITQLWIDLFCGAGGTSTGLAKAQHQGQPFAQVIACVNHDANAIASHLANHPETTHYTEDIRILDLTDMVIKLGKAKTEHPEAEVCLWASLECTNFSNAKGGKPRDADSRTLAEHLYRYITELQPDRIYIENVAEFMAWGPLNEAGKPLSRKAGTDYQRWIATINAMGYTFEHQILNSADFGAYTSRKRFFGQFAKEGLAIHWPKPTHAKRKASGSLFLDGLAAHKPVREVLDTQDLGQSIFGRKKDLADKTLERILAGLRKFATSERAFLCSYYTHNKGLPRVHSSQLPAPTITTANRHAVIMPQFRISHYGNGSNVASLNEPAGTVTTVPKQGLLSAIPRQWLMQYNGSGLNISRINKPAGTVTTVERHALLSARFIFNSGWFGHSSSIAEPCPTVVARQDKAPLRLCTSKPGESLLVIEPTDSPAMAAIKAYCNANNIGDVCLRMLSIKELKRIQGFDDDYVLVGTQKDQCKFIGNSVHTIMSQVLAEANHVGSIKVRLAVA